MCVSLSIALSLIYFPNDQLVHSIVLDTWTVQVCHYEFGDLVDEKILSPSITDSAASVMTLGCCAKSDDGERRVARRSCESFVYMFGHIFPDASVTRQSAINTCA